MGTFVPDTIIDLGPWGGIGVLIAVVLIITAFIFISRLFDVNTIDKGNFAIASALALLGLLGAVWQIEQTYDNNRKNRIDWEIAEALRAKNMQLVCSLDHSNTPRALAFPVVAGTNKKPPKLGTRQIVYLVTENGKLKATTNTVDVVTPCG